MRPIDQPTKPRSSGRTPDRLPPVEWSIDPAERGPEVSDAVVVIDDPVGFPWELPRSDNSVLLVDGRPLARSDMGGRVAACMVRRLRPTDFVVLGSDQQLDHPRATLPAGFVRASSSMPMRTVAGMVRSRLVGCLPDRVGLDSAAAMLNGVSNVLVGYLVARGQGGEPNRWTDSVYQPLPDGPLAWSGWGGPSVPSPLPGDRRWLRIPSETDERPTSIPPTDRAGDAAGDTDDAGEPLAVHAPVWGLDAETVEPVESGRRPAVVGVHVMVTRLLTRRADRVDWIAGLWEQVVTDGFLAFTLPFGAGSAVDHDVGTATAGYASGAPMACDHGQLIEELLEATAGRIVTDELVVHRPPVDGEHHWVTLILRRLGDGHGSDGER